jgi:hypothetical protein
MPIPESQLETWSAQGAAVGSRATYASVKSALEVGTYAGGPHKILLQGSYCNDTNVWSESDVDVVMKTEAFFWHNADTLPQEQRDNFHAVYSDGPGSYGYPDFKSEVTTALTDRYGAAAVTPGNRAIAIAPNGGRRRADVIVAARYRHYWSFPTRSENDASWAEGICFFTADWTQIINYPAQHSDNCTVKHQGTSSRFKPTVRILKNLRRCLVDAGVIDKGIAPSYFIEGLLYNMPPEYFVNTYRGTLANLFDWVNGLTDAERDQLECANRMFYLVRDYHVTWPPANYQRFIAATTELWNTW